MLDACQGVVLRILLRAIERCLREHSPGCSAAARLVAVVFIHRFGSLLNAHLHFHCCILDGLLCHLLLAAQSPSEPKFMHVGNGRSASGTGQLKHEWPVTAVEPTHLTLR